MKTNSVKVFVVYEALFSINLITSILTIEIPSKNNKQAIILSAFSSPTFIEPSASIDCFKLSVALS